MGRVSKDISWVHVDWNVGLNLWRIDGAARPQGFSALALSTVLKPPFALAVEGYAFTGAAPIATRDGGFRFALGMTPRPWLVFDVGGDVGFFPTVRSYSAFVGMSVVPAVWWRFTP